MASTAPPSSSPSSKSSTQHSSSPTQPPNQSPRHNHLLARKQFLQDQISSLTTERNALVTNALNPRLAVSESAESPTQTQIDLAVNKANVDIRTRVRQLQEYNDVKDIGTQLMGLIAENKGVRIAEVQRDFGVQGSD